ncbi:hypothetical protein IU12_17395 [Mycobacterium tuberculosis]|nr:hypothetical protein IQ44_16395 [Mycobacterium tuberculosis]AIH58914.1 hypothetical protein IU12_17395 [Mycobacterium tuberculosis]
MGVESICTQLTELGVPIAPSTYYDHINREPSRRELTCVQGGQIWQTFILFATMSHNRWWSSPTGRL